MTEVTQRYEEGAISVQEVTEAMRYASSENGRYYQSMEKQSKTLAGQISTLKDNFDSLTGTLSKGLSNTISSDVLPSINNLMQNMESAFTENGFSGLAEAAGQGIADMLSAMAEEAPKVLDVALIIVENFVQGIENNLPTIVQGAIAIISQLTTSIIEMLPQLVEMGIQVIIELAKGLAQALPQLIPKVIDAIILITETLLDNIDLIIEAGIQIIVALIEGIMNAYPQIIEKIPIIILKMIVAFAEAIPQLISMGIRMIAALVEGIVKFAVSIPSVIANIIGGIISTIRSTIKDFVNIGGDLIKGLWNGISNMAEWIKNKIKEWVGNVVGVFKKFFGIQSPSKVFKEQIGVYLAQGLGEGFEDELDDVYKDMQDAVDLETSKLSANVETSGTYQMAMAGVPQFTLEDRSENTHQLVVNGKVLAEVVNTENRNREVATS